MNISISYLMVPSHYNLSVGFINAKILQLRYDFEYSDYILLTFGTNLRSCKLHYRR